MPTKERLEARALAATELDLQDAAARCGYASETLRKMMWTDDPPPLYKYRGRWRCRTSELDAWLEAREGDTAS